MAYCHMLLFGDFVESRAREAFSNAFFDYRRILLTRARITWQTWLTALVIGTRITARQREPKLRSRARALRV
jgi:hypothetical protein